MSQFIFTTSILCFMFLGALCVCVWFIMPYIYLCARDLAAANMIGATGLKGKSWPDLDMLPLGWLTDPGG